MNARRSILLQLIALALVVAMSFSALPFLGQALPTQGSALGQTEGWEVPSSLAFGPASILGLLVASFALIRRQGPGSRELFLALTALTAFFFGEHALVLGATLLRGFFPFRPLLALVFGLFVGLAPIMARVEQNPWFGVRTPWTLGSRRVWRATHQATGRLWLVGGLVGAGLAFFAPFFLLLVYLLALVFAPVAISYRVWQKMGRP